MITIEDKSENQVGLFQGLLIGYLVLLIVLVDVMLISSFWQGKPEVLDPITWIGLGVVQVLAVAMFHRKTGAMLGRLLGGALKLLGRTVKISFQLMLWVMVLGIIGYIGYMLLSSVLAIAILAGAGIIAYAIFATAKYGR